MNCPNNLVERGVEFPKWDGPGTWLNFQVHRLDPEHSARGKRMDWIRPDPERLLQTTSQVTATGWLSQPSSLI